MTRGDGEAARSLSSLGLSYELLGESVVGFGAVAWLSITPAANDLADGACRDLRVEETGRVPELLLDNEKEDPALVLAHSIFKGGLQTRALERSVILPARAKVRVPVHCVEAGRWHAREGDGKRLEVSERTGVRTRVVASTNMTDQLTMSGRFAAEQATIWEHVDQELKKSPVASGTRSYEAYLDGVKKQYVEAAKKAQIKPPARANAMVVFPRRGGFWLEAFGNAALLAKESDDLIADLFDPLPEDAEPASRLAVAEVLPQIFNQPLEPIDAIDGALGESLALNGRHRGAVLLYQGELAHLALGVPPPPMDPPPAEEGKPASLRSPSPASRSDIADAQSGVVHRARPRVSKDTIDAALARARQTLGEGAATDGTVEGYRLVRAGETSVSWVDIRLSDDGYAVLGSHERCDLVLSGDESIWLRHLLAACVRTTDGLALRLMDLKTTQPFFFESDDAVWSAVVTGSFAFRLGRHVICGLPLFGGDPARPKANGNGTAKNGGTAEVKPLHLPPPAIAPKKEEGDGPLSVRGPAQRPPVQVGSPYRNQPSMRGTITPCPPISQIQDLLGPSAAPNHVRVTIERAGMGASVELPVAALESGVLLGRAPNCHDGGLRRIFCEAVSRAHVMLLAIGGEIVALDLCSTNGTRSEGKRIRRMVLSDAGATIELAKKVSMRWHRRRDVGPRSN